MDSLCQQYLAQVARLYGDGCAAASVCQPDDGDFLVGVSPERPRLHTRKQLEGMVEVLSNRKPLEVKIQISRSILDNIVPGNPFIETLQAALAEYDAPPEEEKEE